MTSPLRKTPSKENVPTTNAHNIIEENTQPSNLNATSDEANDNQPPIPSYSLPTSTAPTTSPPDDTHEETTKPHPQNIVMTSGEVTSNQIPLPENSVPTSPPPDSKCMQDEKQTKPHPPNIATSDVPATLPTENSSSTSLTTLSPDDTCTQDEKQMKPHPPNLVTITNKPKEATENSSVPSSQVNRDPLLTENPLVTSPPDNKHTEDQECTKSCPQNLITSNKLDKGTDNSSVPSSPISLAKELLPLPTESTPPITIAHITSPPECIPDIEHHDDDAINFHIQQHLQLEQEPLIPDDHENLEVEPIDIPPLIQPDNQPLLQLEPEYLTPAIQETGEDNMPPNVVVVGSLPHLPLSMEDSIVYSCNNSYNTTSDHSSNNRELVHY